MLPSNRKVRAGRDNAVLRPYIDPELIVTAMKTKQFVNILVIQWVRAEDLVSHWSELLQKVKKNTGLASHFQLTTF